MVSLAHCGGRSTHAASSGSTIGYGTAQDCVAAGGQCVIGGFGCAQEGPANTCNCNPGCNPGGAICCVALANTTDISDGGADAPSSMPEASCDATTSVTAADCPSFASSCPCGCYAAVHPQRYDPAQDCLDDSLAVAVCAPSPANDAVVACWIRVDTGDAYLFSGTPLVALTAASGWRPCTAADSIPNDAGNYPPLCSPNGAAAFVGRWLCADDAGGSASFTVVANGNELTETFSDAIPGTGSSLSCTEQFTVSGSTATLIPDLTTCILPQGVDLEGVPTYVSQTISGDVLTYTGEDEGGPLQTVTCTRQ